MDLRKATLRLPFVRENADQTLNLWAVKPTGDDRLDKTTGQNYAALFIHYMRYYDAPHMLHHLGQRWVELGPQRDPIQIAFTGELNQAIICAPTDYGYSFSPLKCRKDADPREAMLSLPFVRENAESRLEVFLPQKADTGEDCQIGRNYAVKAARLARERQDAGVFASFMQCDGVAEIAAQRPQVIVGYHQVMAEAVIASAADGTEPQKRMMRVYLDTVAL